MAESELRPSFPTLNHHLTERTKRPTNHRPPNPIKPRTTAHRKPRQPAQDTRPHTHPFFTQPFGLDTFCSSGVSTQRQTKTMGRVDPAVELAQVCCRFGWNGQPTAFHTGGCRPAARSLTVRGQAVIKCHLDTRPPDDSPPDPCTTDGLPRPSPSSLRQYDPSSARL
ncbi:hypothetical protein PGTUg99_014255 [Puccinia graminis f. sp. tritici]|uniref:Uncharacterized protein n=1 Tax=Puccinia graminis f. sp. tritici TaxID=56615 RepID=A0A5B0RUG2_PUCGR|nr:hypothetical protein PGTUg99_014255 [Puccinia graminis f. sp. tritici]